MFSEKTSAKDSLQITPTKNSQSASSTFFDNPLTQRILSKEDVAQTFRKSATWVSRMMACGALPHHYVGDTAMFYSEEILQAFLSDSLAKPRRLYDSQSKKQEWTSDVRSRSNGTGRKLYRRFGSYQEGQAWINQIRYHRDGGQTYTGKVLVQALFDGYFKAAQLKDNCKRSPNPIFFQERK